MKYKIEIVLEEGASQIDAMNIARNITNLYNSVERAEVCDSENKVENCHNIQQLKADICPKCNGARTVHSDIDQHTWPCPECFGK